MQVPPQSYQARDIVVNSSTSARRCRILCRVSEFESSLDFLLLVIELMK